MVVAGAHGFWGAAYLCAMGAARGGAGLVRLCVPAELLPIVAVKCTEVMAHGLPDEGSGVLTGSAVPVLRTQHLGHARALVLGPGLGRDPRTVEAVGALLEQLPCSLVVDADGLNIGAALGLDWRAAGAPVVLTPHPGEMARLVGADIASVQSDRRGTAARYAAERGAVVVLKGAETVVAAPDGRVHVGAARLVALATGGTGDVLSGLCGAMLSAGLPAFEAAVAAVTVHAEAGAAVQAARGRAGALAGDLLEELPAAQERLRQALSTGAKSAASASRPKPHNRHRVALSDLTPGIDDDELSAGAGPPRRARATRDGAPGGSARRRAAVDARPPGAAALAVGHLTGTGARPRPQHPDPAHQLAGIRLQRARGPGGEQHWRAGAEPQWVHVLANLARLSPDELGAIVESQAKVRETIANDAALHDVLRSEHARLTTWGDALARFSRGSSPHPAPARRLLP